VDLAGRVALVTGAGRRLGQALAIGVARAGCDVAVHYHTSAAGAETTARAVRDAGRRAELLSGDLRDAGVARALPDRAAKAFGRLDVLINSAAVMVRREFGAVTPEDWNGTLALNLTAAFFTSQGAAPHRQTREDVNPPTSRARSAAGVSSAECQQSRLVMLTKGWRVLAEIAVNACGPGRAPDDWRSRRVPTSPRRRRYNASARRKTWSARCCSCSTTTTSPERCFPSMAATDSMSGGAVACATSW
jgi:NAD(P)-dependent dehydrogenase (short-subunit alcohol dehydrogenase family)